MFFMWWSGFKFPLTLFASPECRSVWQHLCSWVLFRIEHSTSPQFCDFLSYSSKGGQIPSSLRNCLNPDYTKCINSMISLLNKRSTNGKLKPPICNPSNSPFRDAFPAHLLPSHPRLPLLLQARTTSLGAWAAYLQGMFNQKLRLTQKREVRAYV